MWKLKSWNGRTFGSESVVQTADTLTNAGAAHWPGARSLQRSWRHAFGAALAAVAPSVQRNAAQSTHPNWMRRRAPSTRAVVSRIIESPLIVIRVHYRQFPTGPE